MAISSLVGVRPGRPELALPLVCDSPHSGSCYPEDFGAALPVAVLRSAEDTHVERLWAHAPEVGATLIAAHFPRAYIDANRSLEDFDARMLGEPWPHAASPSRRTSTRRPSATRCASSAPGTATCA